MEESPIGNQIPDISPESLRRDERDSVLVLAQLRSEHGSIEPSTVRVRNVSTGGLMAQASEEYRIGTRIEIELEGIGAVKGVVAWAEAGRIGIAFDHPIDKSQARKPVATQNDDMLMRPTKHADYRRPGLKPR